MLTLFGVGLGGPWSLSFLWPGKVLTVFMLLSFIVSLVLIGLAFHFTKLWWKSCCFRTCCDYLDELMQWYTVWLVVLVAVVLSNFPKCDFVIFAITSPYVPTVGAELHAPPFYFTGWMLLVLVWAHIAHLTYCCHHPNSVGC